MSVVSHCCYPISIFLSVGEGSNSEDSLGSNYSPLVSLSSKWQIVIKSHHWAWRTFSKLCWHFSCRTCGAWSCFNASRSVEHVNMDWWLWRKNERSQLIEIGGIEHDQPTRNLDVSQQAGRMPKDMRDQPAMIGWWFQPHQRFFSETATVQSCLFLVYIVLCLKNLVVLLPPRCH